MEHEKNNEKINGNAREKLQEEKPKKKVKWGKIIKICVAMAGLFTAILTSCNAIIEYQKNVENAEDLSHSESLYQAGMEFFRQADYDRAIECYENAINDHTERHYTGRETARFYRSLGIVYDLTGKTDEAIECYSYGVSILSDLISKITEEISVEKDRLEYELGYVYYLRGMVYLGKDDYDRAFGDYTKCCDAVSLIDLHDDWESWYTAASVCNLRGEICAGVAYEKISGLPSDQNTDNNTMNYSFTLEDAFDQFNFALSFKGVEVIPYTQIDTGIDITVAGYEISEEEDDNADRVDADNRISYIRKKRLPLPWKITIQDAETARILTNRAKVENMMGLYDEAIEDCKAALAIYSVVSYNEWYDVSKTYSQLALAGLYKSLGGNGEALDETALQECYEWLKIAMPYSTKWRGPYTPQTAYLYEQLGWVAMLKDEYNKAIEYYLEAEKIFEKLGMEEDVEVERRYIEIAKECDEFHNEDNQGWRIWYYNLE